MNSLGFLRAFVVRVSYMPSRLKLGIVAAMHREIKPLVRDWQVEKFSAGGRRYKAFKTDDAALICAGIGSAWDATKVMIERYAPDVILSVGFAGSLDSAIRVPDVYVPAEVVEERSGRVFATGVGTGRLVTSSKVADQPAKYRLALRLGATAVDMEASQVAEVAKLHGRKFFAIKVISDNLESDLSFISDFVSPPGFKMGAFVSYIAVRPKLWGSVRDLLVNSNRAQKVLCKFLAHIIENPNKLELSLSSLGSDHKAECK